MPDPKEQAATQLRNIEQAAGLTTSDFAAVISKAKMERHGEIVSFLKSEYDMTHGNANAMAHAAREVLAGGPPPPEDRLAAQYEGAKAELLPIYDELAALAESLGQDVEKVIQKTGVSFRRKKQFALVQAPSSKRIQLGLNLDATPSDERIVEMKGMCTHKVDITDPASIDDDIASWIRKAYEQAG